VVDSGRRSRPSEGGPLGALPPPRDVTGLLVAWCEGDQAAFDRLVPLVYAELRRVAHRHMRGERPDHLLQTTALVHEAWLRLVDVNRVHWQNRAHFFAVSAQMMRRILVNAARGRDAQKRGGALSHVAFDEAGVAAPGRSVDVVALDDALTAFAEIDPRKAKVVELRFFGGLSVEETAHVLQVSPETVMRDWKTAKLWLLRELRRDDGAAAAGSTP
jgi:RNA polymerase sigma-70 factor (ECF subfamily)